MSQSKQDETCYPEWLQASIQAAITQAEASGTMPSMTIMTPRFYQRLTWLGHKGGNSRQRRKARRIAQRKEELWASLTGHLSKEHA